MHSSGSYDAREPPGDVAKFYASRGYDFLALTDHNQISRGPKTPGLLIATGLEYTQNSASCSPAAAPGYRCLFHLGGVFLEETARAGPVKLRFAQGRYAAYRAQLRHARSMGGIGVLFHPTFHFAADARLLARLARRDGLKLFELSNAALDAQHPGGKSQAESRGEALWDAVLSRGVMLYGIASDDAHHFSDAEARRAAGKSAYTGDRGWVRVLAEPKLSAIRDALLNGEFYASTGVELTEHSWEGGELCLAVAADSGDHRFRFVTAGGKVVSVRRGLRACHRGQVDGSYLRAVVEADDGSRAWIQPRSVE